MRAHLHTLAWFFLVLVICGVGGLLLTIAAILGIDWALHFAPPILADNWGGLATGAFILAIIAICGWTTRNDR